MGDNAPPFDWDLQWFNVKTGKTYYDVITATDWKKLSFDDRDLYRIIFNDTENKKVVYSLTKYAGLTRMEEEPTTESSAAQRQRLPDLSRLSLKPAPAPTDACWFGGSTEVQLRIGFASSKLGRLKHRLIFLPCEGKDECGGYRYDRMATSLDGDFYNYHIMKEKVDTTIHYYKYKTDVWGDKQYATVEDIVKKLEEVVGKNASLYYHWGGRAEYDGTLTGVSAYLWTEVPDPRGKQEHLISYQEI